MRNQKGASMFPVKERFDVGKVCPPLTQCMRGEWSLSALQYDKLMTQYLVEARIEHADDLRALIVDNHLGLLAPEDWHSIPGA